jgi:uncharacterized protein with FMN-binding domain
MTPPNDPIDDIFNRSVQNERLSQLSARSKKHRQDIAGKTPKNGTSTSRVHAAKGSRSTALGLAVVSTLGLAAYLHQAAQSSSSAAGLAPSVAPEISVAPTTTVPQSPTTTSKSSGQAPTTTAKSTTSKGLGDGSFTGNVSTNRFGPVQVKITVSGGKITAVDVPSYPSNDNRSIAINRNAIPRLVQSTLTAQSANVNSVSGATYTSTSYKISLQSAIDKSRAAG